MKRLVFWGVVSLWAIAGFAKAALPPAGSVGVGQGDVIPWTEHTPCPANFHENADGSVENAYCWQYGGVASPSYGAFAERFSDIGYVCQIYLRLTSLGSECHPCDLYVWEDGGGVPGNVLMCTPAKDPCPVALWPLVSTHVLDVYAAEVNGAFWAGYRAGFSEQPCGYFIAADLDGPGGWPYTNIAPGIGYPTGWQDVSVVWGPTRALHIFVQVGRHVPGWICCLDDGACRMTYDYCDGERQYGTSCVPNPCSPVPTGTTSWGRVKAVHR